MAMVAQVVRLFTLTVLVSACSSTVTGGVDVGRAGAGAGGLALAGASGSLTGGMPGGGSAGTPSGGAPNVGGSAGATGGSAGMGGAPEGGAGTGGSGGMPSTAGSGGISAGGSASTYPCVGVGEVINPANNHCYLRTTVVTGAVKQSWGAAEATCQNWGGHLATVSDATEEAFLEKTTVFQSGDEWIGLSAPAPTGPYAWVDGEAVTYTKWLATNPRSTANYMCAFLLRILNSDGSSTYGWGNTDCGFAYWPICERTR